jgi:outer membrane protein assembly factor BamB
MLAAAALASVTAVPPLLPAGEKGKETNWPQWRGPESSGVAADAGVPLEWSDTQNVVWKTAIPGLGHSSPIIWGKHIFLTTAIEGEVVEGAKAPVHLIDGKPWSHPAATGADKKHTLKVLALERDSGKILWERTVYEGLMSDSRHAKASFASPTPVTDGQMVYAFFGTEGVYAFDFKGNLKWKATVGTITSVSVGIGTSPLLYKNLLLLQCDNEDGEGSFIVALDKKTGKEAWRKERKVEISWATPILVNAGKRDELITLGNQVIVAYDPANGQELWTARGLKSNAVPSPVAGHGFVYAPTGYPTKLVMAIRPGGAGDVSASNIAWTYEKGVAYVASPVLYGDYLYLVSDKGILTCLDAKTGELKYDNGRVPAPATFIASLLAVDGHILEFSEDGDAFVVKAGPTHEVVRTNSLKEPIYATPAVAAGRLFIRGKDHLYAIGMSEKGAKSMGASQ